MYAQENEEEIRAYLQLARPLRTAVGSGPALPPPFQERPNLATRLYVRTNTRRILPALLEELSHWMAPARLLSAKLLRVLIIFHEDSLVDTLPTILPALLKALALTHEVENKEDQDEVSATLTHCAELLGWFFAASSSTMDPSSFLPEDVTTGTTGDIRSALRGSLLAHFRTARLERQG